MQLQQTQRFVMENEIRLNGNQRAYYPSLASNRWLAIRLEFIGALVIFGASLFSVIGVLYVGQSIDPGIVGLAVSYALNVTGTLKFSPTPLSC